MRPLRLPNWLLCAVAWRLLCLPTTCSAEDVEPPDKECAKSDRNFDDLFEDEQLPISLIQMKAKQIQGRRSDLQPTASSESSDVGFGPVQGQQVPLDLGSLAQLESRNSFYLLHLMRASTRYRFQNAVLVMGCCLLLVMLVATWLFRILRRKDSVLQVQVRVDHFVTHSQLTSKKLLEGPLKMPVFAPAQSVPNQDDGADESSAQTPVIAEPPDQAVSADVCTSDPPPRPKPTAAACPRDNCKPLGCSMPTCPRELREGASTSLDPSFVLPLCETWYAVCVEPMAICDGAFDILRIAGYPALHGTVRHVDGLRVLEITCSSLPAKQGQVLASVCIEAPAPVMDAIPSIASVSRGSNTTSENGKLFKIAGAAGKHYGNIRLAADGSYVLACGQEDIMVMSAEDGQQLVLRSAEGSKMLASASWFEHSDVFSGAGHMAVRINPGVDTILMLTCSLALTILGGDKHLVRFTCPADRGAG